MKNNSTRKRPHKASTKQQIFVLKQWLKNRNPRVFLTAAE